MKDRTKSKTVSIVGVNVEAETHAAKNLENRRQQKFNEPYLSQGSAYSLGLAYPPPGIMAPGEAGISALVVHDGNLFGATSGTKAHLFWMNHPLTMADIGEIEGVGKTAGSLVVDKNDLLYGASLDAPGILFTYDTRLGQIATYSSSRGKIEIKNSPLKDEGIAHLSLSEDKTTLAGVGAKTGRLFFMNLSGGKPVVKPCLSQEFEAHSALLCAGKDNHFYASAKNGELVKISVKGDVERLGLYLPCRSGKAYLTRMTGAVASADGKIWGGTEDGYLFWFDAQRRELRSCGRPNDIPDLFGLCEGNEGLIYGLTGRGKYASHLVAYDPQRAEWKEVGLLRSFGMHPWNLYQAGAMAIGREGQFYVGECDNFGHLFIYHPPIPRSMPNQSAAGT